MGREFIDGEEMSKNQRSGRQNCPSGRVFALSLVSAILLSACTRAAESPASTAASAPPLPTAEFLALDREGQNVAVYDAFWQQLESNYDDATFFETPEWRTRRDEWRKEAAASKARVFLYHDVFPRLIGLMPESHVQVEDPLQPSNKDAAPSNPALDQKTVTRVLVLKAYGPGFDGVDIRRGNRTLMLVGDVWPNTPAEEAGISPGARLIRNLGKLDFVKTAVTFDVDFVPLDDTAARAWERGDGVDSPAPPARVSSVKLEVRPIRWRKPFESRILVGGVRYLRFDVFGDEPFMKPVFEAIDAARPAGLIVDLRNNVGGLSEQQKKFAAALLGADAYLGDAQDRKGPRRELASRYARHYTGPLAILIGPRSASAAEIFAAAIQDHKRGLLIGRSTNGSVLEARYFPLPDGGYVMVPISNLWRAGGRRIEGTGVEPDIWILPTLEQVRAGRDPVLDRALQELKSSDPKLRRSCQVAAGFRESGVTAAVISQPVGSAARCRRCARP